MRSGLAEQELGMTENVSDRSVARDFREAGSSAGLLAFPIVRFSLQVS